MNPVWPLSPQKDASYYLLHMTPHGKSRAVYIALLQQPWLSHACFFFSHEYVVQGVTSQALDVGNKWPLSCYHLQTSPLLLSMSYEYFTTIPQQYTDPLEPVYTREQWGEIRKKYNLGKLHYLQVNDRVLRYLHIRLWLFFNLLDPTQLDYFNNRMVFDIENINI